MKFRALCMLGGMALALGAATFPLEWNSTFRTDVPYEVEVAPQKLGAASVFVVADGRPLPTTCFPGKLPGTLAVRFTVPAGTKSLLGETSAQKPVLADPAKVDNLFAGALNPTNVSRWVLSTGVTVQPGKNGLLFTADATAPVRAYATYEVPIPEGLAGRAVLQDVALGNRAKLAVGGFLAIRQMGADGQLLPETLCDARWTTHMRPVGKHTVYRDEGHIHAQAEALRFTLELRRLTSSCDAYGHPITNATDLLPEIKLARLAVRVAERLPFPKWNDAFFAPGVSGQAGDTSLRLGGPEGKAMFYQTNPRSTWSQGAQHRNAADLFFPVDAGTVEAWFKPDWKAFANTKDATERVPPLVTLFEAYGGYSATDFKVNVRRCVAVDYSPDKKTWSLLLADYAGHTYEKTFPAKTELTDGVWTHVALQWTPSGDATLFVNGAPAATLPIPEFKAVPLADKSLKHVSDLWATEFYCGSRTQTARIGKGPTAESPFFEGCVDNLRVSSVCRYAPQGFTPVTSFPLDNDTRALFTFDRAFDGVSSAGFGYIPASIRALKDRVDHTVLLDGKPVQYYPEEIAPENDPSKVLSINNYPKMPTDAEFNQTTTLKIQSFQLKAGDVARFTAGPIAYPSFVRIANISQSKEQLRYPILLQKNGLDPRSFGDLSETLLAQRLSDRENVNAVFQYAIRASDYFMSHQADAAPGTDTIHEVTYDALTMLNSYCGFECGPLNNMTANMLTTVAQCPASQTAGYGHSFQQVFFDGKNHVYDLSAQTFFPAMDNETSAYLKEIEDQPGIHNRLGRSVNHFMRKGARTSGAQDPGYVEKCALVINPGEVLHLSYANDGRMNNIQTYNHHGYAEMPTLAPDNYDYAKVTGLKNTKKWVLRRDRIFPHYSTAILSFDGKPTKDSPATTTNSDSFTYRVTSCYPIVWGEYAAYREDGTTVPLELSTDRGQTFRPLPDGGDGVYSLEYKVKARHEYLIRVKAPIDAVARLSLRTEGQVNPRTYPGWPLAGANELTFRCDSSTSADVTFGWREPAHDIVVSGTAKSGTLPGFTRELVVVDPAKPLSLDLTGASDAAKVITHGRVKAVLANDRLVLSYNPKARRGIRHGDDTPEEIEEFPALASVDLIDGKAWKTITVVVSPNARLAFAPNTATGEKKRFTFNALPQGDYLVFMLARFESAPLSVSVGEVRLCDPSPPKKTYPIARQRNGHHNFLKAQMGTTGERANWKWDTANMGREWKQPDYNGFSFRAFSFPEGTDKLDFTARIDDGKPIETAAVLVLPLCGVEARRDLRTILFSMNCNPFR